MNNIPLLALLIAVTNIPSSFQLSAIQTRFPLPGTLILTASIYTGDNSIFLFGGFLNGITSPAIHHFNISSESVTRIGSFPNWGYGVSVQPDAQGNLLYLGGHAAETSEPSAIYKFFPSNNSIETVASFLPYAVHYSSSVKYGNNVYIFCGVGPEIGSIIEYNMVTMESRKVARLPLDFSYVAAILIENKAYIFGSMGAASVTSVLVLNLDTFEIQSGPPNLPPFVLYSTAVYDGEYIYVVGGHVGSVRTDGLIKFNPGSFEWELIPVDNFPVGIDQFWQYAPSSIYVPELRRIYMFGGWTWTAVEAFDRVWYIDLNENGVPLMS